MTVEKDGLVYASEKSDDLVPGINCIIANARQLMPDFGLREQLYAETEFEPYRWILKINDQGWAEHVPCVFKDLPAEGKMIIADGHERDRRGKRMEPLARGSREERKGLSRKR
jgi:hypothetical protein